MEEKTNGWKEQYKNELSKTSTEELLSELQRYRDELEDIMEAQSNKKERYPYDPVDEKTARENIGIIETVLESRGMK